MLDNKAFWFDVEEGDLEMTNEYMSVSDKLHNHYYSIEMMLNLNDLRTEMLHENYMLLTDKAYFKAKSFKKKKKVNHFIDDFYQIAKKIYDDNKYIDTLI